jgi:hypothetical protein
MKPENNLKDSRVQKLKLTDIHCYENAANVLQKAFVSLQCNCALCNTDLEINVSRQDNGEIKEDAYCPQCELRLRSKSHILQ